MNGFELPLTFILPLLVFDTNPLPQKGKQIHATSPSPKLSAYYPSFVGL